MKSAKAIPSARGSPLLSLPFDHYERYALTQQLVGYLCGERASRSALRVLDVGGHLSSLKHFLPDDFVTLTDPQAPPAFTYRENVAFLCDEYVRGIGGHLPFANASFDLVTAHDTLEHVPEPQRGGFIADILRVAKRFVILNGPVYHAETAEAEQRLARFWREALAWEQHPLDEHLALGLPPADAIRSMLGEHGVPFVSIPNGNVVRWLAVMAVKHYFVALPHSEHLQDVIDRTYNSLLSHSDFGGICYREAFIVAKRAGDRELLAGIEAAYGPLQEGQAIGAETGALDSLLEALTSHAIQMRDHLTADAEQIQEMQAALAEQRSLLAARDAARVEEAASLAQREADVHRLEAGLAAIQGTLGYRLLQTSRRGVRRAFPARSLRALPYRAARRLLRRFLELTGG